MTPITVLFSGGQDSTTSLLWAMKEFDTTDINLVSFEYRQRHAVELVQARRIQEILDLRPVKYISIEALADFSAAALTNPDIEVESTASPESANVWAAQHDLPSTFVPGRNMIFLSLAAAYAAQCGSYDLVTGVCEADDAGYPDCRPEFVQAMTKVIGAALGDYNFTIHAPLLYRNKAATFALAESLGFLDLVVEHTHTCYNGDRSVRYSWGYGCGTCPACQERAKGWQAFQDNTKNAPVA